MSDVLNPFPIRDFSETLVDYPHLVLTRDGDIKLGKPDSVTALVCSDLHQNVSDRYDLRINFHNVKDSRQYFIEKITTDLKTKLDAGVYFLDEYVIHLQCRDDSDWGKIARSNRNNGGVKIEHLTSGTGYDVTHTFVPRGGNLGEVFGKQEPEAWVDIHLVRRGERGVAVAAALDGVMFEIKKER